MNNPSMKDAVEAGNAVLINEQATLLRRCRSALDELLADKPLLAGFIANNETLGNLKVALYDYKTDGIFRNYD